MKEARKIQKAGNSSLAISLPRDWVKERGVTSGDLLMVSEDSGGFLKISLPTDKKQTTRCLINADLCRDESLLERIIVGCYLLGYDTMRITSERELSHAQLEEIRGVTKSLPGLEILEQTVRRIVVRCFVDPSRIPVDELLKKLHVMITTMLNEVLDAIMGKRPELARQAMHLENEVNQIYNLLVRQLLLSFRERDLVEEIGIESPTGAVGQRLIAKALEEIGDLIEEIAKTALELSSTGRGITKPLLTEIQSVGTSVQTIFGKTMKALFSKDIKLANDNLSSLKAFGHQIRNVESNLEKGKDPDFSLIMSVLVNLEKVLGYCRIIAETTINMTLTESSDICTIERSNTSF